MDLTSLEEDPRLFLYTSLTAGSSHIITATSRLETILKANRIPFQAIDIATDEKARKLWQRRAGQKKIPGLVKEGYVIGDLEEVEEWNEFGELKENIGPVPDSNAALPSGAQTGVNIAPPHLPVVPTATAGTANIGPSPGMANKGPKALVDSSKMRPLPGAAEIAARNESRAAGASSEAASGEKQPAAASSVIDEPVKAETMTSAPATKEESLKPLREIAKDHPSIAHLSAPASAIQSGIATPITGEAAGTEEAKNDGKAEKPAEVKSGPAVPESKTAKEATFPSKESKGNEDDDDEEDEEDGDEDEDEEDEVENKATEATKGVQGLQVGEGVKTQEQEAKDGNDATKSVED